jgi:Site-specific recombinase XerD
MDTLPSDATTTSIVDVDDDKAVMILGAAANNAAGKTAHSRYIDLKASNTLRRQRADLNLFFQFLQEVGYPLPIETFMTQLDENRHAEGWMLWRGITHGLVEAFLEWQKQRGYAIGSIGVRLATVKTYCKFAQRAGVIPQTELALILMVKSFSHREGVNLDKRREITRVGEKKATATTISPAHAILLKRQVRAKDAAMMCLLLDHGLRCGELAGLKVDDVILNNGTITFYREKVDMVQTHRLSPDTLVALMAYLPLVQEPYLFPGYKGKQMTTSGINKRVGELGKKVGLDTLSPHDCRHYWATAAMRNGTDVKALQTAGGWKSPAMPLRYAEASTIANDGVKI